MSGTIREVLAAGGSAAFIMPLRVAAQMVETSKFLEPSAHPRVKSYLLKSKVALVCMLIERSYIYNILAAIVTLSLYPGAEAFAASRGDRQRSLWLPFA